MAFKSLVAIFPTNRTSVVHGLLKVSPGVVLLVQTRMTFPKMPPARRHSTKNERLRRHAINLAPPESVKIWETALWVSRRAGLGTIHVRRPWPTGRSKVIKPHEPILATSSTLGEWLDSLVPLSTLVGWVYGQHMFPLFYLYVVYDTLWNIQICSLLHCFLQQGAGIFRRVLL